MLLKNITISGLGGVGGYYGAMLVEAARREGLGRTISFVARGAHRAAIEERGLHVHTPERDFTVRPDYLAEDPHDLPPTDLLILATKSYDLEANIQQLRPIITPRTIILPLLNGADITDQIQALLPEDRVWDGCVYISGRKPTAGEILLEAEREIFLFGSRGAERSAEERELFALLESVGVHVVNPDDIEESIRKKFLMISATATGTSYYNMTVGEALASHPVEMRPWSRLRRGRCGAHRRASDLHDPLQHELDARGLYGGELHGAGESHGLRRPCGTPYRAGATTL